MSLLSSPGCSAAIPLLIEFCTLYAFFFFSFGRCAGALESLFSVFGVGYRALAAITEKLSMYEPLISFSCPFPVVF